MSSLGRGTGRGLLRKMEMEATEGAVLVPDCGDAGESLQQKTKYQKKICVGEVHINTSAFFYIVLVAPVSVSLFKKNVI